MKPLFGNTFDLNGDGRVGFAEELFGYTMMQKMRKESSEITGKTSLLDEKKTTPVAMPKFTSGKTGK